MVVLASGILRSAPFAGHASLAALYSRQSSSVGASTSGRLEARGRRSAAQAAQETSLQFADAGEETRVANTEPPTHAVQMLSQQRVCAPDWQYLCFARHPRTTATCPATQSACGHRWLMRLRRARTPTARTTYHSIRLN